MQIGLSAHTESGLAIGGSWLRKYPCRFDFYLNNTHISTAGDDLRKELFHKVYREHSKEIFFYIQKFTREQEASEDILQETFIIFLQKVNLEMAESARSFLYSIARSLALKHLNKQKRFIEANLELITDGNKSSNDAEKSVLRDQILAHLAAINPLYEEIYLLRVESAMKLEEIVDVLKIPPRSLNRRIQEMKEILYQLLNQEASRESTT
jgi:RNA polymerase sigma-70 factor (ECF subfamily)